ncbi:hypothetical protein BV22DRAFT_836506 [Leucogyrophana mollusca]|uniref:Uncharacterized protein n=1 Tax=Leucogyrophana mollusca TaxID=85980 RepID=A0ACB8B2N9_9AGAM|nr:hypothetical protein BV22DRAFT_836506 [Leucogyrophana mollusca]
MQSWSTHVQGHDCPFSQSGDNGCLDMPHGILGDPRFLGSVDRGLLGKFAQTILISSSDITAQHYQHWSSGVYEAAIVNAANVIRITRICQLSSAIIIIYDHLITFNQEVEFIWKRPWSLATVIYLIVRYVGDGLGLLDAAAFLSESPSQEVRQVFLHLQGWPSAVLDWLMQIILQMRIYALYQRSNKVLSFTALGYLAEIIAMSTILGIANAHIVAINEPIPGIGICSATNIPASFYRFWLPIIAFEGTLCLLALWVGIRDLVSGYRAQGINGVNVLEVLVKDSVFYFLCLVLACVVNAAMWQTLGESWLEVPEGFSIAAKVVIGCRLILNLPKMFAQRSLQPRVEYISMSTHSH